MSNSECPRVNSYKQTFFSVDGGDSDTLPATSDTYLTAPLIRSGTVGVIFTRRRTLRVTTS